MNTLIEDAAKLFTALDEHNLRRTRLARGCRGSQSGRTSADDGYICFFSAHHFL